MMVSILLTDSVPCIEKSRFESICVDQFGAFVYFFCCKFVWLLFNPLEFRGSYSATSNNMKLVVAFDGWAVTFGTARRGLGRATACPGLSSLYQM